MKVRLNRFDPVENCGSPEYMEQQHDLAARLREAGRDADADLVIADVTLAETYLSGFRLLRDAYQNPGGEAVGRYADWLEENGHTASSELVREGLIPLKDLLNDFLLPPFNEPFQAQLMQAIDGLLARYPVMKRAYASGQSLDRRRRAVLDDKEANKTNAAIMCFLAAYQTALAGVFAYSDLEMPAEIFSGTSVITGVASVTYAAITYLLSRKAETLAGQQQLAWNECPLRCIDPNR